MTKDNAEGTARRSNVFGFCRGDFVEGSMGAWGWINSKSHSHLTMRILGTVEPCGSIADNDEGDSIENDEPFRVVGDGTGVESAEDAAGERSTRIIKGGLNNRMVFGVESHLNEIAGVGGDVRRGISEAILSDIDDVDKGSGDDCTFSDWRSGDSESRDEWKEHCGEVHYSIGKAIEFECQFDSYFRGECASLYRRLDCDE